MALEGVVDSAGGLRVAQRGAPDAADSALRVDHVRPVAVPPAAPTEAQRADGVVWRRHWIDDRRLVIDFLELCLVEVELDAGRVVFDRGLDPEMEQHLLFDHVLPLVLACRGALVVHGAVISREGRGVVLIGRSGSGKSTLTAFAWQQGWTVGGDDGAVLSAGRPPTVEPTYATVRLTPASTDLLGLRAEATSPVVGKMRIRGGSSRRFQQAPVELGLIASIEPAASGRTAMFDRLGGVSAHALLFGSTFHAELRGHRRLPAVVEQLGRIVDSTTVGRLVVPRGLDGLIATEELLRAELSKPSRAVPPPSAGPSGA